MRNGIEPYTSELYGFGGSSVFPKGKISLSVVLGDGAENKDALVEFIVVEGLKWYNAILGRPTIYALDMVISRKHLVAKFHTEDGEVIFKGMYDESRRCNIDGMKDSITLMVLEADQLKELDDKTTRIQLANKITYIRPWEDQSKVISDDIPYYHMTNTSWNSRFGIMY